MKNVIIYILAILVIGMVIVCAFCGCKGANTEIKTNDEVVVVEISTEDLISFLEEYKDDEGIVPVGNSPEVEELIELLKDVA